LVKLEIKKADELKSLIVGELKNADKDTKLILFRSLRNALLSKEKLDLPPGVSSKSKDMKAAIRKRIEQMGYSVINFNYRHAKYTPQDHKCNETSSSSSSSSSAIPAVATANENLIIQCNFHSCLKQRSLQWLETSTERCIS
jgi:hypothetical protein